MSKKNSHKLLDFLAGKGFYVVLILCIAAIGVSGYMLFFGGPGDTPDSPSLALVSPGASPTAPARPSVSIGPNPSPVLPPSSPPSQGVQPTPPDSLPQSAIDPGDVSVGDIEGEDTEVAGRVPNMPVVPSPSPAPEPTPQQQPTANKQPDFFPPVNGTVLVGYSEVADVYYEAMREWRFHPGVDIETAADALVRAAADGVVKDVVESAGRNMGASIVIEHSGGFITVYSNLTGSPTVAAGQNVQAGDTIGAVGETSAAEQALPPHLHFEILKDGEPVDPMEYLPEMP